MTDSTLFGQMEAMGHRQVTWCCDPVSGLKSIIAVHDTTLGPALGGTRMWPYNVEADALKDVLRLSRAMTFKAAISGLNLGGGKAVIIGNAPTQKSEALMRRYGKFVHSLNGNYITAEDVGTSPRDMEYIRMETPYVVGLPDKGGDPSPVTAYGVYLGMRASAKFLWGNESLEGKKIIVQGTGSVGTHLVAHLVKENAHVLVSDINQERLNEVSTKYGVEVIEGAKIMKSDMDIYAPCALGATLNDESIAHLKCAIVAGAANNQLADEVINGEQLRKKGIIYAPDFLINAGGLINCYAELHGRDKKWSMQHTETIYTTTLSLLERARDKKMTTHAAALELAKERITSIRHLRSL